MRSYVAIFYFLFIIAARGIRLSAFVAFVYAASAFHSAEFLYTFEEVRPSVRSQVSPKRRRFSTSFGIEPPASRLPPHSTPSHLDPSPKGGGPTPSPLHPPSFAILVYLVYSGQTGKRVAVTTIIKTNSMILIVSCIRYRFYLRDKQTDARAHFIHTLSSRFYIVQGVSVLLVVQARLVNSNHERLRKYRHRKLILSSTLYTF